MVAVNENDLALLEEYRDWAPAQQYPDTSVESFLIERETNRLARNAEAVLLFLQDWSLENQDPTEAAYGLHEIVDYLLNAEVGDPEIEEWFAEPEEQVVTEQTLLAKGFNRILTGGPLQSYNTEEGYYEDEEPR